MSGTITVGDKILASHDNVSGKLSMSGDVVFPAGHFIQHLFFTTTHNGQNTNATYYYYGGNTGGTGATGTPLGQITLKQPNAKLLVVWTGVMSTGSHNTNAENAISTFIRYSTNNDLSSPTEKQLYENYSDMRAGGDLPQQTLMTKTGRVSFTLSNSANDVYYFGIKDTKYGWSAGWVGGYGEGALLEIIEIQQ